MRTQTSRHRQQLDKFWQRTVRYAVHAAGHPAPPKIRAFIDLLKVSMKRTFPRP